jgi:hypothetical protein
MPVRQGDVLEWLCDPLDDVWHQHAVVVTADCDIAHAKHGGVLACAPILRHEDHLARFPMPERLERSRAKLQEQVAGQIRDLQARRLPGYPQPLSDEAIMDWLATATTADSIAEVLGAEGRDSETLRSRVNTLRRVAHAMDTLDLATQLHVLAEARAVTQGKALAEGDVKQVAVESIGRLKEMPGDTVFLHSLGPGHSAGYVVYLRLLVNLAEDEIATIPSDLQGAGVRAKRIARLTAPYLYYMTQRLGQIYSAIGLPAQYEGARMNFIERRVAELLT